MSIRNTDSTIAEPPIWRGRNFDNGGILGKPVLIVGESTYPQPGDNTSKYNVLMAEDHIAGYRDAFRTKLIRVFLNSDDEDPSRIEEFWHSVAYANFIIPPLAGPRVAPTVDMWENQHIALAPLVVRLRPSLIVALGYRMWERWASDPKGLFTPGPLIAGAKCPQTLYLNVVKGGRPPLAYGMKHPSSAFSWRTEHPYLTNGSAPRGAIQQMNVSRGYDMSSIAHAAFADDRVPGHMRELRLHLMLLADGPIPRGKAYVELDEPSIGASSLRTGCEVGPMMRDSRMGGMSSKAIWHRVYNGFVEFCRRFLGSWECR